MHARVPLAPIALSPLPSPPPCLITDLYHLDHYMGGLANYAGELIGCQSYTIAARHNPEAGEGGGSIGGGGGGGDRGEGAGGLGEEAFVVEVVARNGAHASFEFVLARQEWGLRAGSWQTRSLVRTAQLQDE